jgi:hypothetical protein
MNVRLHRPLALALALALTPASLAVLPSTALAEGVEMSSYQSLDQMSHTLVDARRDMDTLLFNFTVRQTQMQRAEGELNSALSAYGPDSADAAVTRARYDQIKEEALKDVLQQFSVIGPKLEQAERDNRQAVRKMLQKPANFEALVKGHLKGEKNTAVMAVVVYVKTRKLNNVAKEIHSKAMEGKLDHDLKQLQKTLELVDSLVDFESSDMSLDELLTELNSDDSLGASDGIERLDELDSLLD